VTDAHATQNAAEVARAALTEGTVIEVDGWPLVVRRAVTGKKPDQLRGWSLVTDELAAEALSAAQRAVAVPVQSLRSHELTLVLVPGETVASVSAQASGRAGPALRDVLAPLSERLALERTLLDRVPQPAD